MTKCTQNIHIYTDTKRYRASRNPYHKIILLIHASKEKIKCLSCNFILQLEILKDIEICGLRPLLAYIIKEGQKAKIPLPTL